jgi:serine/threonine protein phosphatase PrpC
METIKRYLDDMDFDENQIKVFLEANETEIKAFLKTNEMEIKEHLKTLWEKQFEQASAPDAKETTEEITAQNATEPQTTDRLATGLQAAEVESTANNTQTDMPTIINSGEQPDREKVQHEALTFEIKNKRIIFQNGKINQEYCVHFDVEDLNMPEIAEVYFEGLEKIGLRYDPEAKQIKGIPVLAGDHKIEMQFKRKDWIEGKPLLSREVTFIINPDPKSLWKNIPTSEDIEYYKSDADKQFVKVASKKVKDGLFGLGKKEVARKDMVAASQRGRSHAIDGKPRDDDFALYFDEQTEWYVMVVADGAGSAQFSRKGSQIACQTVIDVCKEKIAERKDDFEKYKTQEQKNEIGKILQDIISHAVYQAHKAIEKEAKEKNRTIKDYATTLLLSLCKQFQYGWFVGAWWVGDGGIGIYAQEPPYLKVLGEPDGGEFAGQTRFLTMPEIIQNELYTRIKFDIVENFTALILMTDGVTDPKFETDANLNRIEKWHALWDDLNGNNEDKAKVNFSDDNEQTAEQLLRWLDFWSKGNHDDRTIAILF